MARRADLAPILVVAVEYIGPDVPISIGGRRRPVLEHAYDIGSGMLPAHRRRVPRVAFPDPQRGWPTAPESARCGVCTRAVTSLISDVVGSILLTSDQHTSWFALPDAVPPPWLHLAPAR